jgi:serine/threonine-protein kinase
MTQPTWIGHNLGGRYLIEGELGHGGMSAVFKATDSNLRRVVAVKLIHSHLSSDPEFVRRFEAEARVVAQLRHPNIVQVYDYSHEGNTYYIVFEFVPGETLQDRLKRLSDGDRQMEMDEVLKIATQMGEALHYAHERDIVHRDIKPANVMLNVHGDAILTDFGIVKIVGGTQHTATGAVLGTARYMSPEQIKGERVDLRTDLYSFGVMLYEMVGGRAPFNSDSAMTLMMMHVSEPVPDVRSIRSGVPPSLVRVINRSMAKEPDRRYQSLAQLLADLRQMDGRAEPVAAVPAGKDTAMTMLDQDLTELIEAEESYEDPTPPTSPTPVRRQTVAAVPRAAPSPKKDQRNMVIIGLAFIAVAIVAVFLIFSLSGNGDDGQDTPVAAIVESPEATEIGAEVPVDDTDTPPPPATDEPQATAVSSTDTPEPTATPPPATATDVPTTAPTQPPTATSPPPPTATSPPPPTAITRLAVQITGISLSGDRYVVSYDTFGYTETLPGMHVHFFFNTVPPDQAGAPGGGPWKLYGGPRPFTEYGTGDRPGGATQMCALVANADHSVMANSGNCMNLP